MSYPANTVAVLAHRLRSWPNTKTALVKVRCLSGGCLALMVDQYLTLMLVRLDKQTQTVT